MDEQKHSGGFHLGMSDFNGNNSISGLVNGRSVSQCFTSSLDPGNTSNMSHEAIANAHGRQRNDAPDHVTEMLGNSSSTLVKSVDEGVFS